MFNSQFSVAARDPIPAYRSVPNNKLLGRISCKRAECKASNDSTISYLGKTYQLMGKNGVIPLKPGSKIIVLTLLDGSILAKYNDEYYELKEFVKPTPIQNNTK